MKGFEDVDKLEILKYLTENNRQIIELKEKIKRIKLGYSNFYEYHNTQLTNIIIDELVNATNDLGVNNWEMFVNNYRNSPALISIIYEMIESFDIYNKETDEPIKAKIEEHYNKYLNNNKYDYISPIIQCFLDGGYSNNMYDGAFDAIEGYMQSEYNYRLKEFKLGKDEHTLDFNMYSEQLNLLEEFNKELKKELDNVSN
jgi:hypothetical protein